MIKKIMLAGLLLVMGLFTAPVVHAQTTVKKVILEVFWWNYWNNNYPNGWANYLTELAPRLKAMGIDAVWIPPSSKGAYGTSDVGYGMFDNYDLGDKFQKGDVKTRIGTKDELLRMFAVMHANGIEVIQDVVPNQLNGAGDLSTGGYDPAAASNNKYKNFRYVSFANPAQVFTSATAADSANEYLARTGRFSKNWQNFHDNPAHNGCESNPSDDWCHELFGPDVCYYDAAMGQSSNASYNPVQTGSTNNGYMRNGYRNWMVWLKKQTGFDGIRLDAAKHYEYAASEDWLYNLQHNAGFAGGTDSMFAVGEFIGDIGQEDGWCNNVQNRAGTFDFNLRGALKGMVDANGFYDMSTVPGAQQNNRVQYYSGLNAYVNRTVPFVNNHDTYRPILDVNGNDSAWDSGNELGGHIDPNTNPRDALAYATMMAMDGNPQLFLEDVFVVGKATNSKRFTHLPTNTTDLPIREPFDNLIWCHQNLQFKNGAYKVRSTAAGGNVYFNSGSTAADLLIIERSNKALIGLNDNGANWQSAYVDSDFPPGTVLKDYSGANGTATYTVPADKRVNVNVPPVDPANHLYGYAIWAPVGISTNYIPTRSTQTTQEWEMADDLGDSHCSSSGQGGALPANATKQRVVGKIFAASGQTITYKIYPETDGYSVTASLWNTSGTVLSTASGTTTAASPLTGTYTPVADGWLVIKVRNTTASQPGQRVWVDVTYTAPAVVNTLSAANAAADQAAIWTGNKNTADVTDCGNWEEGKMPDANTDVLVPSYATPYPVFSNNTAVKNITIENGANIQVNSGVTLSVYGNWMNQNTASLSVCGKIQFAGNTAQELSGKNNFCQLELNTTGAVNAHDNITVSDKLICTAGKLVLNSYTLTLSPGATTMGGNNSSYVQFPNTATGGYLIQEINSGSATFPVGNNNYTPVSIVNNGTVQQCQVRCFEDVLANGTSGSPMATTEKLKKTWEITPASTGAVADITLTWDVVNNDATFNTANAFIAKNTGGAGQTWNVLASQTALTGTGPFSKTATGVNSFSKFTLFSNVAALPVHIVSFTGQRNGNLASLQWTVASQDNVVYYEVLKSFDGVNFTAVGNVAANQQYVNYLFTDSAFTRNAYYKLRIEDNNSKEVYSNVIFLRTSEVAPQFHINPNPAHNYASVTATGINDKDPIAVAIINSNGAVIAKREGNFSSIKVFAEQSIAKLPGGIYLIKFTNALSTQTIKMIKE
ncbi:MAG: T9SS type A sorting domain-containing protein [Bacteroidetes bacterium]|nr:T9SS type A sorting domain-containing protein [Bacteroidota bacterium]